MGSNGVPNTYTLNSYIRVSGVRCDLNNCISYRGYLRVILGMMEKNMETTIKGFKPFPFSFPSSPIYHL